MDHQRYARAERFLPWNGKHFVFNDQVVPQWIDAKEKRHDRFWYRVNARGGHTFILVDPAAGTREPAFDHVRLAAALSEAAGRAYTHTDLPFEKIEFVEDGARIAFVVDETKWTCDLQSYALDCEKNAPPPEDELRSPDGKWAAFIRGHNLYVRGVESGEEIALTTDGKRHYDYATLPEGRTSAISDKLAGKKLPPAAVWSPDSGRLVAARLDQRRMKELHLLQHVPPDGGARPVLHTYRYAMVGDADRELATSEFFVFDIAQKTQTAFQTAPELTPTGSPITRDYVWWSEDGQTVYYISQSRDFRRLRLYAVEAKTGAARQVIEECGRTHLELNVDYAGKPNVRVINAGAEIIWFSQRDGWGHLYLYNGKTGELKRQITAGAWLVRDVLYVDERDRQVYFTAGGREDGIDPYYALLYRVGLDGGEPERLSQEDAEHRVKVSPTGRYFVDACTRLDLPPVTVLRDQTGAIIQTLEEADASDLLATGWQYPERFRVRGCDGRTDVYGAIFRPTDFDPQKSYPVIDSIYPGPQRIQTAIGFPEPGNFRHDMAFWDTQAQAELGFIVVTIDGMGTPLRSKAFHDVAVGNLQDNGGLGDHVAALKQLALRYPYMDLDRVGIYGHSGGGFTSTKAILTYPDFYKVAVSTAGNHDNRAYLATWGERYQGLLEGDNYVQQANASLAANLKGRLFLIWGEMDDNVHPASTIQLIDALIKANKDFDLLVMPNRNHSFFFDVYYQRRRWDYFVRHLLGAAPPAGYVIRPEDMEE